MCNKNITTIKSLKYNFSRNISDTNVVYYVFIFRSVEIIFYNSYICSVCPIFKLSSVTGKNLDLLKTFLNVLSPLHGGKEQLQQLSTEFQVTQQYRCIVNLVHLLLNVFIYCHVFRYCLLLFFFKWLHVI